MFKLLGQILLLLLQFKSLVKYEVQIAAVKSTKVQVKSFPHKMYLCKVK